MREGIGVRALGLRYSRARWRRACSFSSTFAAIQTVLRSIGVMQPTLIELMSLCVRIGEPADVGSRSGLARRVFPVVGGGFEGERVGRGEVLPHGLDAAQARPDGTVILDVRLTLRSESGALVYLSYGGIRRGTPEVLARLARGEAVDPSEYYLRTAIRFETGDAELAWLEGILAIGIGARAPGEVRYRVYEVG